MNGDIHVGHVAGYLLPADITARFFRLRSHEVLMASGSDCFGTPITVQAEKEEGSPEEIVKKYHSKIVKLFNDLNLSFDIYTKTTTPNHRRTVQEFLTAFWDQGLLSIKNQKQYYSPATKRFLPDRYVEGTCPYCGYEGARSDQCDNCGQLLDQNLINPHSKIDTGEVVLKETTHAFIEWGKLQDQIERYVKAHKGQWRRWIQTETENWLTTGLKARPVTRDLDWGVEIPEKIAAELPDSASKRIYVWFDAVTGYFSASLEWAQREGRDWQDFWYGDGLRHYYFMGKDNLVFHTLFWPGQLMTYDKKLHLPDVLAISQYLNLEGKAFSKSRGITVDTQEFIDKYGEDPLRFYLFSIMPESADASFSWEGFFQKNNSVLVGHIGNYVHRTLSIYNGFKPGMEISEEVLLKCQQALRSSTGFLEKCEFKNYGAVVESLAQYANQYFNICAPWVSKKSDPEKFLKDSADLVALTYVIILIFSPVTPASAERYFEMVGLESWQTWPEPEDLRGLLKTVLAKIQINNPQPLFKKFDSETT